MTASLVKLITSLLLSGLLLSGCSDDLSVEQHIIGNLEQMETAAEAGKHLDFMSFVADDFAGQYGSMDRREFHRFMIFQMNQNRRLYATFFPIHVREHETGGENGGAGAFANFRILVTGGGGLLPERGQLFEVKTDWVVDGGDWLLLKADWEAVRMPE